MDCCNSYTDYRHPVGGMNNGGVGLGIGNTINNNYYPYSGPANVMRYPSQMPPMYRGGGIGIPNGIVGGGGGVGGNSVVNSGGGLNGIANPYDNCYQNQSYPYGPNNNTNGYMKDGYGYHHHHNNPMNYRHFTYDYRLLHHNYPSYHDIDHYNTPPMCNYPLREPYSSYPPSARNDHLYHLHNASRDIYSAPSNSITNIELTTNHHHTINQNYSEYSPPFSVSYPNSIQNITTPAGPGSTGYNNFTTKETTRGRKIQRDKEKNLFRSANSNRKSSVDVAQTSVPNEQLERVTPKCVKRQNDNFNDLNGNYSKSSRHQVNNYSSVQGSVPTKRVRRKKKIEIQKPEHREEIVTKDVIPLPGFQQAFGSFEIGRFSEVFFNIPESPLEPAIESEADTLSPQPWETGDSLEGPHFNLQVGATLQPVYTDNYSSINNSPVGSYFSELRCNDF